MTKIKEGDDFRLSFLIFIPNLCRKRFVLCDKHHSSLGYFICPFRESTIVKQYTNLKLDLTLPNLIIVDLWVLVSQID